MIYKNFKLAVLGGAAGMAIADALGFAFAGRMPLSVLHITIGVALIVIICYEIGCSVK